MNYIIFLSGFICAIVVISSWCLYHVGLTGYVVLMTPEQKKQYDEFIVAKRLGLK